MLSVGLSAKRFELFRESAPGIRRVGVFWDPSSADKLSDFRETEGAARAAGIQIRPLHAETADDLGPAFEAVHAWGAAGLVTLLDRFIPEVANFAARSRLPSICERREFVMAGGLMSYGPNPLDV